MHCFGQLDLGLYYGMVILRMWYNSDCVGVIGPFDLHCEKLALKAGLLQLMEEYDFDPVLGLLAFANEIYFTIAE